MRLSSSMASASQIAPVSVVIPLHNEAASVTRLLLALDGQRLRPFEVVCVNAGSDDGTSSVIRSVSCRPTVRIVEEQRLNPGEARNVGVRAATCNWIAFADGGTEPSVDWLMALTEPLAGGSDVVFGSFEPACDTLFRRCAALAYVSARGAQGIRGPFVASMALRREVFDAVGGFPGHRASEDLTFMERILTGGFRVAYAPSAIVRWDTAPNARSTFRRFALYSRVNLEAGRASSYHFGLARHYLVLAALLVLGCLAGVAGYAVLLLVPVFFLARVLRAAARKHVDLSFDVWQPRVLAGAAVILVIVDAAILAGVLRWMATRAGSWKQ